MHICTTFVLSKAVQGSQYLTALIIVYSFVKVIKNNVATFFKYGKKIKLQCCFW